MAFVNFRNIYHFKSLAFRKTLISNPIRTISCSNIQKLSKTKIVTDVDDPDKPIKYSTSDAAHWKAQITRGGVVETGPWYQSYVIAISLGIFMVYFFILREESDVDLEFNKNLYDRISGLEEKNLEIVLEHNKAKNLPSTDIENRLIEIRYVK